MRVKIEVWKKCKAWFDSRLDVGTVDFLSSAVGVLYGRFDNDLSTSEAIQKAARRRVPAHVTWLYCFGGMAFFLFIVAAVTGVLLSVYYHSAPDIAHESVQYISTHVWFGSWVRNLHRWAGDVIVVLLLLHMLRVFFVGAYKNPRELNWMVGVILFFLVLAFRFTGQLLPWDHTSYWVTRAGLGLIEKLPIMGGFLSLMLRGSGGVSAATLSRFYSLHVLVLPGLSFFLMIVHFMIVRAQGISEPL